MSEEATQEPRPRLPRWKLALFAAIPTALALLGLNFVLGKLRPPGGPARSIYTDHPYRWTQLKAGVRTDLPVGPEAEHWKKVGRKYRVEIDSHGFRGPERPPEKDDKVLRIVAMGDSATFGWDVEEPETFARALDRMVNEGQLERRFEVFNAGVPGYASPQGRLYLEQDVLPMKPDFVTISYGTNDEALCRNHWSMLFRYMPVSRIFRRDADGKPLPVDPFFFAQPGVEGTATYRFLADLARRVKAETGIEMDLSVFTEDKDCRATPVAEYEENLYRMGLEVARAGGEALFLAIATGDEDYVLAMERAASTCGSEMYDMRAALASALPRILAEPLFEEGRVEAERLFGREFLQRAPKLYYTTDYGHPNAAGHRVLAEEIAL
ncbi:MAG: SGNH/GDSL hydrolase family protein, partial [Candidatus Methylomirabilis sp.]|nr:SGNH/GDSL hydrolase family protein [Deltaproteobacteria bacterium]